MRSLTAVAAAALLASSVGCQTMNQGMGPLARGQASLMPGHIATSANAPRPTDMRGASGPPGAQQVSYDSCGCGCGCETSGCDMGCGCGDGCGCECGAGNFGCLSGQSNGCINVLVDATLGGPSCCPLGPGDNVYDFQPGPPAAQTAYPYYTTRGPRDFLMAKPPSIGPTGAYGCR